MCVVSVTCLSCDCHMTFRDWLDSQPGLISSVVYTYLSLIPCHAPPALTNLRDQEVRTHVDTGKLTCDEVVGINKCGGH